MIGALLILAKYSAERLWVRGDGLVIGRAAEALGGAVLALRTDYQGPRIGFAVQAIKRSGIKAAMGIAGMGGGSVRFVVDGLEIGVEADNGEDLPEIPELPTMLDPEPEAIDLTRLARVAAVAAGPRDDRPGLCWVEFRGGWAMATDEVLVARCPAHGQRLLPAHLIEALASITDRARVGDRPDGVSVLEFAGGLAVVPSERPRFPRLRDVWPSLAQGGRIGRKALLGAVRAAVKGSDCPLVCLHLASTSLGGEASIKVMGTRASCQVGAVTTGTEEQVQLDSRALLVPLAKGSDTIAIAWDAWDRPIGLIDGKVQTLVFPVVTR